MTNWLRWTTLVCASTAVVFALAGCGGDGEGAKDVEPDASAAPNAGTAPPVWPSAGADADTAPPVWPSAGAGSAPDLGQDSRPGQSPVVDLDHPIAVGGCEADGPGPVPSAELPRVSHRDQVYTIELGRWGISNAGRDAAATTQGLNEAISWANKNGKGTVRLPGGTYLVGKKVSGIYSGGIELPSDIHFELDEDAVIQMATNDSENYCVVAVSGQEDVHISGGTIRGDRDSHPAGHEEGHAICVWGGDASARVLIENMTLTDAAGDGVLINGGNDAYSQDITIRGNDIANNRRQGVSIVGGSSVVVENNAIHHTHGAAPQFGIDIEGPDYTNKDILIRNNSFYQNQGGDYVNTDGRNVWLLDNVMDQTGLRNKQTDGPIIFWRKSDQVIRGNTVTVTVGSSNGPWGLVTYPNGADSSIVNVIEDNTFYGGGINVADMSYLKVTGNTVHNDNFVAWSVSCLQFDDNEVIDNGSEYYPFLFRDARGNASGNLRDGKPVDLPLSPNRPLDYQ